MLILLNGRLGSGKDTVFERIRLHVGDFGLPRPERIAFADPLKDSACALLGIDREEMEALKRDDSIGLAWVKDGLEAEYDPQITMRLFLQRYGTEAHRDIFGDDFWVKAALPDGFDHSQRLVVVTDCRFENEAERGIALGGYLVVVRGPGETDSWDHPSEKPLSVPADYIMRNEIFDDGFSALDTVVRDMLLTFSERARDDA